MLFFSFYCLLDESLCVYKPLCTSRRNGPSSQKLCRRLAALVTADGIAFCAAVYISAGLHGLDSCSTYARELGVAFKYVRVYALSLTCFVPSFL